MTDRLDAVEQWFGRLVELDASARTGELAELHVRDPAVAAEVRALLAAHDKATGPLERLTAGTAGNGAPDRRLGRTIGHYRIDAVAGVGGMGVVYRAHDTRLGRDVAVKFLPEWMSQDLLATERLLNEARVASGLDHPNICTVHEVREGEAGEWFVVMTFYQGETVKDRLARGPIDGPEALDIAHQVARGLAAAHARGIVHRDIKPGNLLLTADGLVKVLDFGIAKAADLHLTRTGERLGTVAYMAPEQLAGDPVDARADLWALGVVLQEMLTGRRPRMGDITGAALAHLPSPVAALLREMLQVDPTARIADAETVARAVERIRGAPSPRAQAWWRVPAVVGTVGVLLTLVWNIWGGERPGATTTVRSVMPAGRAADIAVAVLPFRLVGEGMEFWREGIVDLLTFNLDGLGGLRKIDPQAVATVWGERIGSGQQAASLSEALDVARALGVRYAITGTAVELESVARLTAEVHDLHEGTLRGSTFVDGDADSVFALVDGLALALVRDRLLPVSPDAPMVNLERVTTTSVPALKSYLEGERAYRLARWADALTAYRRATELDSTFARAWFRLALAADWLNDGATSAEAHEVVMRHRERLTARDRRLVDARTMSELSAYVTRYPDDPEGWSRYGDGAFHHGGNHLFPVDTSRVALQHAVRLLPHYGEAYSHLIEEAFARRDSARVRGLLDGLSDVGGGRHTCPTERHLADAVWGTATARQTARAILDTMSLDTLGCGWTSLAMVPEAADRLEAAEREPMRAAAPLPGLRVWRAMHARLMRGQAAATHEVLEAAARNEALRPFLAEHAVRLHVAGYLPSDDLAPWVASIERAVTPDAQFWLGVLAMHRGERSAVEVHATAIERAPPLPQAALADAPPRYAEVLRALERLLTVGDTAALRTIEQALPTLPTMSVRRDHVASYVRQTVGQWLLVNGNHPEAERYLRSVNHYEALGYLPAQLGIGTILEARGEIAAARRQYQLVSDWWQDADVTFRPMRDSARAGLARLAHAAP